MAFVLPPDNTFDPTRTDFTPETLALDELIARAQHNLALGLRVALPCSIVAVLGDQLVALQPLLMTRFSGQAPQVMAQLHRVPVVMPRGAGYSIQYPLSVGDTGLAIFADRNIDSLMASGGKSPVDPNDDRCHDLSDAIFIPGLGSDTQQTTSTGTDLVLKCQELTATLGPSGTLEVRNQTAELVDLVGQLSSSVAGILTALNSVVISSPGSPLFPAPVLTQSLATAENIATLLKTFRGS
jgi:hypothetical protein